MSVTREARYLSGIDVGKTVTFNLGAQDIDRKLVGVEQFEGSTMLYLQGRYGSTDNYNMSNRTLVIITGTMKGTPNV